MRVYCDYCGESLSKSAREFKRYKHHFCNRDCYHSFRRNVQKSKHRPRDMSAQIKIKALAKKLASIRVENGQRA